MRHVPPRIPQYHASVLMSCTLTYTYIVSLQERSWRRPASRGMHDISHNTATASVCEIAKRISAEHILSDSRSALGAKQRSIDTVSLLDNPRKRRYGFSLSDGPTHSSIGDSQISMAHTANTHPLSRFLYSHTILQLSS